MNEKNLRTQGELVTEGDTFKRSPTSEDSSFIKHSDGMELEALDLLHVLQTAAVTESTRTQPPAVAIKAGHTLNLHRKHRSLLRKRQTSGSTGKSRHRTHVSEMFSAEIFLQHVLLTANCFSDEHLSLVLQFVLE